MNENNDEDEDDMDWENPLVVDINKECRFSAWMETSLHANLWGEVEKKVKRLLKILQTHLRKITGIAPWEGYMDNEYSMLKKKDNIPKGVVSNRIKYSIYLGSNYLKPIWNKAKKITSDLELNQQIQRNTNLI